MQKPVDLNTLEFKTKPLAEFWEWIDSLYRNGLRRRSKHMKSQLPYFYMDEYNHYESGVYIYCGYDRIPLIAISKIEFAADYNISDDRLWSMYTEVASDFRHQGIGTALKRRCFQYAAEQGKTLLTSSLSDEGAAYLLPKFAQLVKETGASIAFGGEDSKKYPELINSCFPTPVKREGMPRRFCDKQSNLG